MKPPTIPMFAEGEDAAHGFMCLTDFECELGNADGGSTVYSTVEELRERRPCVAGCGIVKVEVRALEIVQPERHDMDHLGSNEPGGTSL